jgi:PAS domain S-box-containing protein
MIQQLYVLVFALAGAVCLAGLIGVRELVHPDVRRSLAALLVLSGAWGLLTAAQFLFPARELTRFLHAGALTAGLATVFAWLAFASAYTGRRYHRERRLRAAAVVTFLAIVAVKLTNPVHGLYFSTSVAAEPFVHTAVQYHAPHWFATGFSYTAAAVGFVWLFDSFGRDAESGRPWVLYGLVAVTAVPIVPYALSSYSPLVLQVNYEPLGVAVFALGVVFYARSAFSRYSTPGESTLADSLSEAGLVLDGTGTVINHNERAAEIIGETVPRAPIADVDAELAALDPGERGRVTYEVDGTERVYEAARSPVSDSPLAAETITLKDVTRATRLEQLMGIHRESSEALVNATDPWEFVRGIPDRFAAIDAYGLAWLHPVGDGRPEPEQALGGLARDPGAFGTGTATAAGVPDTYTEWAATNAEASEPVLAAARAGESRQQTVAASETEWSRRLADAGITECLAVPVSFGTRQSFVLGVYTADPSGFDPAERQLIEDVCRRLPETVERLETHEEALQYKEAIARAGTAIFITDTEGTIEYVNPAFERLTGYSAAEAVGETPRLLKSGETSEAHYERLWETITAGEIFEERIVNRTKEGDRYIAQQTISPVTDEDGEPVAFVAIQFELTDKLLREQRLSVLNRVLRHNLRTAVNVIDGHASLLADRIDDHLAEPGLPAEIRESLATIREHSEKLADQSETARDIEEVLSGNRTGPLRVPVEDLAGTAESTARDLGGDCSVAVDDAVAGAQVDARLQQAVEELVENAIVHSDRSPEAVDVRVRLERAGEDLAVVVADDGPGMSEQELVFLENGEEDPLRHSSGLDLWLVHWLTVSLGGRITAETGADGTTIRVTAPLRDSTEPEIPTR